MTIRPLILCADIGGTNTRLALFDGTAVQAGSMRAYKNKGVAALEVHLARYLDELGSRPDAVSLALAGPVHGSTGTLANLDWTVSTEAAAQACCGARAVLLNDLQAQGFALPALAGASVETYRAGAPAPQGAPCLVLGIGTGMNISQVLTLPDGSILVPPSEAGHTRFSPHTDALRALRDSAAKRFGAVEAEHILSGRGMALAYAHVTGQEIAPEDVINRAQSGEDDANHAVGLVVQALGGFAGDMALVHMPAGGIYLVGGAARALAPFLAPHGFDDAYLGQGRYAHLIDATPVRVVHDDFAALTGAARYAVQALQASA